MTAVHWMTEAPNELLPGDLIEFEWHGARVAGEVTVDAGDNYPLGTKWFLGPVLLNTESGQAFRPGISPVKVTRRTTHIADGRYYRAFIGGSICVAEVDSGYVVSAVEIDTENGRVEKGSINVFRDFHESGSKWHLMEEEE